MKNIHKIFLFFAAVCVFIACSKDKLAPIEADACESVTFSQNVVPVLETKCNSAACHGSGASFGDFTDTTDLMAYLRGGQLFSSLFVENTMPKSGSLTTEESQALRCWIDGGGVIDQLVEIKGDSSANTSSTPDTFNVCDSVTISFDRDVEYIIQTSCAKNTNCHASGTTHGNFDSFDTLKMAIDNGSFAEEVFDKQTMPSDTALSALQLQTLKCWIEQGALDDRVDLCATITYAEHIGPLLTSECSTCHGAGGTPPELLDYDDFKAIADNGRLKVRVIDQKDMPADGALTDQEIQLIECWLDAGSPNN